MKNILICILFIILIFSIIKIIPNNKLKNIDIILISSATVIICLLLKYHFNKDQENYNHINNNKSNKEFFNLSENNLVTKTTVQPTTEQPPKLPSIPVTAINSSKSESVIKQQNKLNLFPFSLEYLKEVYNDFNEMKKDDKLAEQIKKKISENSKNSEYYEILIQFIQTNMEQFYKYLNTDNFNKINEFIIDIKNRRNLNKDNNIKDKTESRELSQLMKKYLRSMLQEGRYIDDYGFIKNMTNNDMKYSMYNAKDHEMLGTNDPTFTNKWDNDYVLLNTDKWRPSINHNMYKCKQEIKCPVCPTMTSGYPVKLKEFDMARKVLPPDNINIDYINDKLLTGLA